MRLKTPKTQANPTTSFARRSRLLFIAPPLSGASRARWSTNINLARLYKPRPPRKGSRACGRANVSPPRWCFAPRLARPIRRPGSSRSSGDVTIQEVSAGGGAVIADPLVRNLATLGGNLAHGDPANDHPATMLALGAEVVAAGPKGERRIPITSFFTGPFATALKPDEILVEICVPIPPARSGGAYLKLERKVGDFATAAVAVQLTLAASGACDQVGIGLTSVGLTAIKATGAEAALKGNRPDDDAIKRAAQLAAEAAQPSEDLRGSVEYKRDMVRVLTARALRKALERAGAGR